MDAVKLSRRKMKKEPPRKIAPIKPVLFDLSTPTFDKDAILQEKERVEKLNERKMREEWDIEKKRRQIKEMARALPTAEKFKPSETVKKSKELANMESSIKSGNFFDVDHKKYLAKARQPVKPISEYVQPYYELSVVYESTADGRHRIFKPLFPNEFREPEKEEKKVANPRD